MDGFLVRTPRKYQDGVYTSQACDAIVYNLPISLDDFSPGSLVSTLIKNRLLKESFTWRRHVSRDGIWKTSYWRISAGTHAQNYYMETKYSDTVMGRRSNVTSLIGKIQVYPIQVKLVLCHWATDELGHWVLVNDTVTSETMLATFF